MMRRRSTHKVFGEEVGAPIYTLPGAKSAPGMTQPVLRHGDVTITRQCCCQGCPKRWILAFALCFMRICQTALRQDIGIALVCMTQTADDVSVVCVTETGDDVSVTPGNVSSSNQTSRRSGSNCEGQISTEFQWSSELEGQVLSAPYYAIIVVMPLAGYLDHAMGSCRLLTLSLLVGGVLSLLTPALTRTHRYLLVVNRVLVGAASAIVKPAVFSLWAHWAPVTEQGILTAVDYAGSNLGGIITFFFSGFLCTIPFDNGWPFVFYVVGVLCLLCAIGVYVTVYDRPDLHPSISAGEMDFIRNNMTHEMEKGKKRAPWSKIARSPAVWAIVVAHCCHHWVFAALVSYLPMFISEGLDFHIAQSGMLSAAGFVGSMAVGVLGGAAADRMQKRIQIVHVRKAFQMVGSLGLAVPMGVVCWLDRGDKAASVVLLIVAVSLFNFTSLAYRINSLDIAPEYASFITAMSSTIATALSVTAPLVTSAILQTKSLDEWRIVLIMVCLVSIAGGVFYVIFARGDRQEWAYENSYDVTVEGSDVTVKESDVTVKESDVKARHHTRSLPDDFREPPGTSVVLSVRRLQSLS